MAENSNIGWTDHTWNPWWGCKKVSPGCKFCYIDGIMRRAGYSPFDGPILTKTWNCPAKWQKQAVAQHRRFRIFTCSMSDFFHEGADEWRPDAWKVIKDCPNLDWMVLTKRPENIVKRLPADWGNGYPNVWLGVSCENSEQLWRVEMLSEIPARIRFVSAEPLLEGIDFTPYLHALDWIITGCEQAGKDKRRLMAIQWVRDIAKQCRKSNVPHFFKQYYQGTSITADGMLDGRRQQAWPK